MKYLIFVISSLILSQPPEIDLIIKKLELGHFQEIKNIIDTTADIQTKNILSAYLYFYKGDYIRAYNFVKDVDEKFVDFKRYLKKLCEITKDFEIFESTHLIFYAKQEDVILYEIIADAFEKIVQEIGMRFDYFPKDKIRVEVYPNETDFSFASTIPMDALRRSGAVGICKFNRIMILSPKVLPRGYRWIDTIAHEYIHFVINRITNGNCPLWLHEGLAKYYDTTWRADRSLYLTPASENILMKMKLTGKFIDFKRMEPSLVFLENQDEVSYAFAQLGSFVDFILSKYGEEKLFNFLRALSTGANFEATFKKHFKKSLSKVKNEYLSWVKKLEIDVSHGIIDDKIYFSIKDEIDEFIGLDTKEFVRLGDRLRINRYNEEAIIEYRKALDKEPHNPIILMKMARAYIEIGDHNTAIKYVKNAIDKNPNFVSSYELLGEIYYKLERYDEALNVYQEVLHMNPFNHKVRFNLGEIYFKKGEYKLAEREFKVVHKLNPGDIKSVIMLEKLKEGIP